MNKETLRNNIWWTYKSRIQTEKRLLANNLQFQIILFWYSFFSVIISVYYLSINSPSKEQAIIWVSFSILIFGISTFINGLSFEKRANSVKNCYEELKRLELKLKDNDNKENTSDILKEYLAILNNCENHTDTDFSITLCIQYISNNSIFCRCIKNLLGCNSNQNSTEENNRLNKTPTAYHWFIFIKYYVIRFLFLSVLYIVPLLILLFCQ